MARALEPEATSPPINRPPSGLSKPASSKPQATPSHPQLGGSARPQGNQVPVASLNKNAPKPSSLKDYMVYDPDKCLDNCHEDISYIWDVFDTETGEAFVSDLC